MNQEVQKVATPALLRPRLIAFREGQGKDYRYLLQDQLLGQIHQFEPWQFFILEVLPGCDDFSKLASVFEDRFGHSIKNEEVEELFSSVVDKDLFRPSADSHPMLMAFNKKRETQQRETSTITNREANRKTEYKANEEPLPAGVADDIELDDTMRKRGWKLFNPTWLIKLIQPLLSPFKYTIYLLPVLLIAALFISARHAALIEEDLIHLRENYSIIKHILFGMVTVNLLATLVKALVAYTFRATVSGFCIVTYFVFIPRFMVRIGHVQQLSRRERIWLHAAPLLLRLGLSCVGILVWFNTRTMDNFLASFALSIAIISATSMFLTANPLVKSNGYHLIAAFLNEPHLMGKSYKALINKFRGKVYQKADNDVLVAYALASILFMVVTYVVILLILGRYLKIHLGGASVFLIVFLGLFFLVRTIKKFKKIGQLYERSIQFERWRDRTLPKAENDTEIKKSQNALMTYSKRAMLILFLVVLFVPYNYEPGGYFVILPNQRQEITAEVSGIIEKIYFDGGEFLKKDTAIGQISHSDDLSQVKIYTANMKEQQAVINDLKSMPRPEEVQLAEQALEVEKARARFSKENLSRLKQLYERNFISLEDLDEARRQYEVDIEQMKEREANLELVKSGATSNQIAAAEAKLQSYKEMRDYSLEKVEKSVFYMPFDGKLITMHLKQKIGSYLNKGEPLAVVENTNQVISEIEVNESDIGYIKESSTVRNRPFAYYDNEFTGIVTAIDENVIEKRSGKVVKVLTLLENKDGLLKSGMSGYAKITSETLPLWKVLSLAIIRFIKVEVWSWSP